MAAFTALYGAGVGVPCIASQGNTLAKVRFGELCGFRCSEGFRDHRLKGFPHFFTLYVTDGKITYVLSFKKKKYCLGFFCLYDRTVKTIRQCQEISVESLQE